MIRFLSAEWVAAANDALASAQVPPPAADGGLIVRAGTFAAGLVAEHRSGTSRSVTLRVAGNRLTLHGGRDPDAAVTVRVGWEDAVSFMAGTWTPTEHLADGRAQVWGDLSVVRAIGEVLEAVQPQLASVPATSAP